MQGISGIYADIYSRLASDQSVFPSIPERALRLRESLSDPSCNIAKAARLIQTDPGLAAFILRAASSVRFLTRIPPKNLEAAVRRIGLYGTVHLATTFSVRSAFDSPSRKLRMLLMGAFRSASRVAVISYFLADRVTGIDPGKAMLAGLLQDVAQPPILRALEGRPEIFEDPLRRNDAIDQLCPLVGVMILKGWGFDAELIEAVRSRKQWFRDPGPQPDLADVVLVARLHSLIGTPDFKDCPPLTEMPAFHKLALGELTPEQSLRILEDSRDELVELERLLGGRAV